MTMAFQVSGTNTDQKSSTYSHFMLESENIVLDKVDFKEMLKATDFQDAYAREQVIKQAKGMFNDEVYLLFSELDNTAIRQAIHDMERLDSDMRLLASSAATAQNIYDQRAKMFENSCYYFVKVYSAAQHHAKLGLQTTKGLTDIDKLFTVLDTGKTFKNSFGIPISPEMLVFALGLVLRSKQHWDNVIMIDAMPGTGKTTFDYALTTTMIDVYSIFFKQHVDFDVEQHVIVSETREYCNNLISNLKNNSILMFIEAGNQFSSKKYYDDDQLELVNTVERIRFHGLTLVLEWNTIEGLDKTIRDRRATAVVSLEERGKAIVRGFNRNPAQRGLTKNPRTKNDVVISAEGATKVLEADALKAMVIPYYPLPKEAQDKLDARKELGKKLISRKKQNEQYYQEYLCTLPSNAIRITSEHFYKWAIAKHRSLGVRKLAVHLAEAIGLGKTERLFINTDIGDANVGYIDLNEFMKSYIEQLRAQQSGATQYEKEQKNDDLVN
jgi:hypothetical protein